MEVSGQPQAPTALTPEKGHSVSTEQEAGLAPERVSSFGEKYKSLSPSHIKLHNRYSYYVRFKLKEKRIRRSVTYGSR